MRETLTVRELIAALADLEPDAEVFTSLYSRYEPLRAADLTLFDHPEKGRIVCLALPYAEDC
jgi:hypothetical protein